MSLISREVTIEHLYGRLIESANNNVGVWEDAGIVFEEIATERLKSWINEIPTADPVKHGRWIHDGLQHRGGVDWMHCSECGKRDVFAAKSQYYYCPNCGAKMEEK